MNKILNMEDIHNITDNDLREIFDDIELTEENSIKDDKDICTRCDKKDTIIEDHSQGTRVCNNCGQVNDYILDSQPEWRQYDDGKGDVSRCSQPINKLLPQSSLGTSIGGGSWKSRLKTLHGWSAMPYKERSLNIVFKEIHARCQKAGIMKCIEDDAKIMYKSISESKHMKGNNKGKYIIIRGANRRSLIAACVFFACKKKGMTRSPKEISELFELKYTEITKGCKNFMKMVKLRKLTLNMGTTQPEHFILRFCNELKVQKEYINEAIRISKNIKKLNVATDHTPFSVAIGSILLMATSNNLNSITKKRLGNKFGVSEVTITKAYGKIKKYAGVIRFDDKTNEVIKQINEKMTKDVMSESIKERFKKFNISPEKTANKIIEIEKELEEDYIEPSIINEYMDEYDDLEMSDDMEKLTISSLNDVEDPDELYQYIYSSLVGLYTKIDNDMDRYKKTVEEYKRCLIYCK
jgi:transcription initiation factor TFIIIB Brf1 subunit/transcription initiation factor TFIIB